MKLYLGGAEVPGWRKILAGAAAPAVSLSYVGLSRRVKKLGEWRLEDKFPAEQQIFLDSGAYSLNKQDAGYSDEQALELYAWYQNFVALNLDRVSMVSEFDALQLGREWRDLQRASFWDELGDKFLPIWHAEDGPEELECLTRQYRRVGILQADGANLAPLLNAATGLSGALLHGVAMTRMETMRSVRWDSVGSTSWLSPSQYGDTFVWTGKELKRYPKAYKENARRRHRTLFTDNGFDAEKIAADDTTEVLKLSIWSWTQFVADIERHKGVTKALETPPEPNPEHLPDVVDTPPSPGRNEELGSGPRERVLLPVLAITNAATKEGEAPEPRVGVTSANLMQCTTCYMKDKCPMYRPGEECAYEIPMVLTTTTQVRALRKTALAMQGQRVAFARMIEQVEGGYPDANLSAELRLLWKMLQDDATADKDPSSFEIKVTGTGNPGMISRVFGGQTADRMNALEAPVPATDALAGFGIVDVEVIEEEPARRGPE